MLVSDGVIDDLANFRGWAITSSDGVAHFVTGIGKLFRHDTLRNVGAGDIETACGRSFVGPSILFAAGEYPRCRQCARRADLKTI